MEKIELYQAAILDFLNEYALSWKQDPTDSIRTEIVVDKENKHFQLVRVGWKDQKYYHYCLFHFDIIDGKVWIQANNTEEMVGDELIQRGIPKKEIILGFQPENVRIHTGFGIA